MFKMFSQYGEKKLKKTVASKSNKSNQNGKKRENPNLHDDVPNLKEPRPRAPDTKISISANQSNNVTVVADNTLLSTQDSAKASSDAKNHSPRKVKGNDITALVNSADPISFVQKRISKDFDGVTFFGTVTEYDDSDDPAFWKVVYDDGDAEDYNKWDLIKALKHYGINGKNDRQKN